MSIKDRIAQAQQNADVEARITAKLASGKFTDTGAKYTPEQAVADHSNAALRMTARVDGNGKLTWSK